MTRIYFLLDLDVLSLFEQYHAQISAVILQFFFK